MKRKLLLFVLMLVMMFSMMGCEPSDSNDREDSEQVEDSKDDKEDDKKESEKESEKVTKGTLTISVPDGFVKSETAGVVTYSKENVGSNIVINKTINDGSLKNVTADSFLPVLDAQLESAFGAELTLNLVKEQKIEVDGHEGFIYAFSYTVFEVEVVQTQYIFENDDVYEFITFTDITSEGYTAAFDDCAKSISYE